MRYGADNRMLTYEYDRVGRVKKRITVGAANYATTYSYLRPNSDEPYLSTPLVESIVQTGQNFSYTYDDAGNISSMTRNGVTTTYAYDTLGQLLRVNDPSANKTTIYSYDMGGNIVSCTEYAYTTGAVGAATKSISYLYGDSNWKDKLTSIDGKTITYDQVGNPLTFDGWTFTWKAGRMLASMVKTGTNAQFTYDHNGLRIKKVVNGVTTSYTLNGKNIVHMTQGSNDLHFFYDAQDKPAMVRFNGVDYFYVYNLQGDVVAMIDANGTQVVEYYYDAWGAPVAKTGSMAATLGTVNPFRYRGYVYDEETGLYYLRSRYYNPVWKRFVNPDAIDFSRDSILGYNLFAYCGNKPESRFDNLGFAWETIFDVISLGFSIAEVIADPYNPQAWFGLVGDAVDLIPFVTGVGETIRGLRFVDKVSGNVLEIAERADDTIDTYRALKRINKGSGKEVHHIIEKRFVSALADQNTNEMLSIALTKPEHRMFTNLWRQNLKYGKRVTDPLKIFEAATEVYFGYPQLMGGAVETLLKK